MQALRPDSEAAVAEPRDVEMKPQTPGSPSAGDAHSPEKEVDVDEEWIIGYVRGRTDAMIEFDVGAPLKATTNDTKWHTVPARWQTTPTKPVGMPTNRFEALAREDRNWKRDRNWNRDRNWRRAKAWRERHNEVEVDVGGGTLFGNSRKKRAAATEASQPSHSTAAFAGRQDSRGVARKSLVEDSEDVIDVVEGVGEAKADNDKGARGDPPCARV